ncbi:sensor histidine kinase [Chondrinema litorale]|uniref:sensor histidine kinase n=1 Tax=Chondrinema litorale TaxID=2994555 RepID=UPI002543EDE7|nr:ATP-binding protein [Chondrinema litorale]UZR93950.1 ATP-binding protein [Chondrinema litorale]
MFLKSYRVNILFRILLLILSITLFLYCFFIIHKHLRAFYVFVLISLQFFEFFYFTDKVNRDLSNFMLAVTNNDFSSHFGGIRGNSFEKLYNSFNQISNRMQELNNEREMHFLQLQTLIDHIDIGILSFDKTGEILLLNPFMKEKILNSKLVRPRNINELKNNINNRASIFDMKPGERKLLKIEFQNQLMLVSFQASAFKLKDKYFTLISAHDIKSELVGQELDSWQKLIRILTHEIMNSVAPITSLSSTLLEIVKHQIHSDTVIPTFHHNNLINGLSAIEDRGNGLLNFTEAYKNLTRLPQPIFKNVDCYSLIKSVIALYQPVLYENGINLNLERVEKTLSLTADPNLLEQVFINLLNNAADALQGTENPEIKVSIFENENKRICFTVADNACGMDTETMEQIFIPFYTTKERGSGIGLSFCRQVMYLHRGEILVSSATGKGTKFTLIF